MIIKKESTVGQHEIITAKNVENNAAAKVILQCSNFFRLRITSLKGRDSTKVMLN